jgi:hypothetical protein
MCVYQRIQQQTGIVSFGAGRGHTERRARLANRKERRLVVDDSSSNVRELDHVLHRLVTRALTPAEGAFIDLLIIRAKRSVVAETSAGAVAAVAAEGLSELSSWLNAHVVTPA